MKTTVLLILLSIWLQLYGLHAETSGSQTSEKKIQGIVFHDKTGNGSFDKGKDVPLPGIAVSNGREIAVTDQSGYYELPVNDNSVIFVIKPENWMVPLNDKQMPRFYYIYSSTGASGTKFQGLPPTSSLAESVNFPLYPSEEPDSYDVLLFGDTQPRNRQEVYYVARDVLSEVSGTHAAFGVTLGDVVFDNLDMTAPMIDGIAKVGIPWIYVVGNHDLDLTGNNNLDIRGAWYRTVGPTYFSFTYGPVHYIVLDNIRWIVEDDRRFYRTGLGADQMEFLRNSISRLESDQLLVLLAHIPWTGSTAWEDDEEQKVFYDLISSHPNSVSLVGHTHRHYHHMIGKSHTFRHYDFETDDENDYPGSQPHHMISIGTVCGAWWTGAPDEYGIPHAVMTDGTPTSYNFLEIDGNTWKVRWKAARRPDDFQMHIHVPEAVDAGDFKDLVVTATIFNALPDALVEMKIGEGPWVKMEKTHRTDPVRDAAAQREKDLGNMPWRTMSAARPSEQLWEASTGISVEPGAYLIQVRSRDAWWEHNGRQIIYVW
jgi:hypothetical protein